MILDLIDTPRSHRGMERPGRRYFAIRGSSQERVTRTHRRTPVGKEAELSWIVSAIRADLSLSCMN